MPLSRALQSVVTCLTIIGTAAVPPKSASAGPKVVDIRVEGTSLEVRLSDGRSLTGTELVGAVLTIADRPGRRIKVRIDGAERDPEDPRNARWLYRLMTPDPESGAWTDFCEAGPKGRRLGFPVAGTTTADGAFELSETRISFTCTAGAVAKCIRFGYEPWAVTEQGLPLLDHFRACMRMVRADYCGDGQAHTRNGTLINLYDRVGVQRSEPSAELTFEAAWGPASGLRAQDPDRCRLDAGRPQGQLRAAIDRATWPGLRQSCGPVPARGPDLQRLSRHPVISVRRLKRCGSRACGLMPAAGRES